MRPQQHNHPRRVTDGSLGSAVTQPASHATMALALVLAHLAFSSDLTRVFSAGDAGVTCYRIPAIVQTEHGTLIAFAEARISSCNDHDTVHIAARRSVDGGNSWGEITFIAGNASARVGNPTAVFDAARGRTVLVLTFLPYFQRSGYVTSDDEGLTWSAPRVADGFGPAAGSLTGPGTALVSRTGRILVASHHGGYDRDFVSWSDDGGESWTTSNATLGPKMDEAALAQLSNGSILIAMRHKALPRLGRALATSDDDGATWTSPITYDSALKGDVCQGSLVSFGGVVYLASPACRPTCANRANLTLFSSADDAATWQTERVISSPGSAGYSCLVTGALLRNGAGDAPGEADEATVPEGGVLFEGPGPAGAVLPPHIEFARFPLRARGGG